MVDLTKLLTLRDKTIKAKDFDEPCTYYLDHFGENPEFLQAGAPADMAFLTPILQQIGNHLLRRMVALTVLPVTEIAEYQFMHGACLFDGQRAGFFYFKDIDMGILSLPESPTTSVLMARFSCVYQTDRVLGRMH